MKAATSLILAGALALSAPCAALAQQQTPAAPAKPAEAPDAAKRAKDKQCSDQADAKKLHGDERKAFREKCKRGAGAPAIRSL
jgi:hypothetical protein